MTTPRSGLAALRRAALLEVQPGRERPVPCMSDEEWGAWDMYNRRTGSPAQLPCVDCTPEFAERAGNCCTGVPGMTHFPQPVVVLTRSTRAQPPEIRQARRRASWRAYRARIRARKL